MHEEAKEENENLIQNLHLPGLLSLRTPEHEAGVLTCDVLLKHCEGISTVQITGQDGPYNWISDSNIS
jgi:hypothetical protein